MSKITPFLMFKSHAKDAVALYVSLFKNAKIHHESTIPGEQPLYNASFSLDGQEFNAMDGGETFSFAEGLSLFVSCENQAEVDHFWEGLTANGGKPGQCGWLTDPYGVSWQIIPTALTKLMSDPDREKAGRVMQSMLKMTKLIVADLEAAYAGE